MLIWNGVKKEPKYNMILLPNGMTEKVPKKQKLTHRYPMLVPVVVFLICLARDKQIKPNFKLRKVSHSSNRFYSDS